MIDKILNIDTVGNYIVSQVVFHGMPPDVANELHYEAFKYFKEQEIARSYSAHVNSREVQLPLVITRQDDTRTGKDDSE